jgi:hypothetical protein
MKCRKLFPALKVICSLGILLISVWGVARSMDTRVVSSGEIAKGHQLRDVEQVGMAQLRDVHSIVSPAGASERYAIDCLRGDSLFLRVFLDGRQVAGQLSLLEVWNLEKISLSLKVNSSDSGDTRVYVFGRSSDSEVLRVVTLPQNNLPLILRVLISSDEVQVHSVVTNTVVTLPLSLGNLCGELVIAPGELPEVLTQAERIPESLIEVTFGYLDRHLIENNETK